MRKIALGLLALLALPAAAWADPVLPDLQGEPVVDAANVIPDDQERALDAKLMQVQRQTGRQIAVATIADLNGYAIDDYAHLLFRKWRLGRATLNDGVLIVVAPNDHQVRIQTGEGLGPYLTDAQAKLIAHDDMTPHFAKKHDWAGGIGAGVDAIATVINPDAITRKQEQAKLDEARRIQDGNTLDSALSWIGGILLAGGIGFGAWFAATAKRRKAAREEREREEAEASAARRRTTGTTSTVGPDSIILGSGDGYGAARSRSTYRDTGYTPTPTPAPSPSRRDDDDDNGGGFAAGVVAGSMLNDDDDDDTRRNDAPAQDDTPADDFTGGGGTDDGGGATDNWSDS